MVNNIETYHILGADQKDKRFNDCDTIQHCFKILV